MTEKIEEAKTEGVCKGEICNRDGCIGIIEEHESDGGCSCHTNPPCDYCTTAREYCPVCSWDAYEEQVEYDRKESKLAQERYNQPEAIAERKAQEKREKDFIEKYRGSMEITEFDCRHRSHTHFTMRKYGVYPSSMTQSSVEKEVRGTFGGRFERFGNGRFEYIAYTD